MLEDYISEIDEKKWEKHPRVKIQKESSGDKPFSESGRVTSEMLERRNFRMNKPFIPSAIYFNDEATADTIPHYVHDILEGKVVKKYNEGNGYYADIEPMGQEPAW